MRRRERRRALRGTAYEGLGEKIEVHMVTVACDGVNIQIWGSPLHMAPRLSRVFMPLPCWATPPQEHCQMDQRATSVAP